MDDRRPCTICGSQGARLCTGCQSAAYCSVECQQTDWRPHRLLCRQFRRMGPRPSPSHRLVLHFPMDEDRPTLAWADTEPAQGQDSHYLPVIDHLLAVPGNDRHLWHDVQVVQGNLLRGRPTSPCTMHVYYLDDVDIRNLATNKALHGTHPTLLGDAWGEMIWKGPVVAVLRSGPGLDPPGLRDVDLTAYRDAIDFLGYFLDGYGSMIDGVGSLTHFAQRVVGQRSGKAMGVRVNCTGDRLARREPALVPVAVPKTHPLFNLEGDDLLATANVLGKDWVAGAYRRGGGSSSSSSTTTTTMTAGLADDRSNPEARNLLLRLRVKEGKWAGPSSWWNDPAIGSVLVVDRRGSDLGVDAVEGLCRLVREAALPLMTEDRAPRAGAEDEVADAMVQGLKELPLRYQAALQ
ncbi:hypothetical protein LX36DRAFT_662884 [Colletotrichum falcatum]|nr:hypothetical protein LX36DRAFT_662884 [Colletotrichum falcatum]